MMSGRSLRIGLLAVLGLLIAAGLGAAASRITSEQVGLYGEPPSVGSELVSDPAAAGQARAQNGKAGRGDRGKQNKTRRAESARAEPAPPSAPAPVADDSGTKTEHTEDEEDFEPPESELEDSDDD